MKEKITLTIYVEYDDEAEADRRSAAAQFLGIHKYGCKLASLFGKVKNPARIRTRFTRDVVDEIPE